MIFDEVGKEAVRFNFCIIFLFSMFQVIQIYLWCKNYLVEKIDKYFEGK